MRDTIFYRNYGIEYNFYGQGEYSVFFAGDDVIFNTITEAEDFVDKIISEREDFDKKIREYNQFLCKKVV